MPTKRLMNFLFCEKNMIWDKLANCTCRANAKSVKFQGLHCKPPDDGLSVARARWVLFLDTRIIRWCLALTILWSCIASTELQSFIDVVHVSTVDNVTLTLQIRLHIDLVRRTTRCPALRPHTAQTPGSSVNRRVL